VLVVDDDEGIVSLLEDFLALRQFVVEGVRRGDLGVERLTTEPRPEVVILDKNLPDMAGTEVLRRARERGSDTEAVLVTGYPNLDSALKCIDLGCFAYLCKPVDLDTMADVAARAADRCRRLRSTVEGIAAVALPGPADLVPDADEVPLAACAQAVDELVAWYRDGVDWRQVEASGLAARIERARQVLRRPAHGDGADVDSGARQGTGTLPWLRMS
jgi:DNA-binding response OmpR family regulator